MTKLEALYRRIFCDTITIYKDDHKLKIGEIYFTFQTQPIQYIYVGNNKLWVKKIRNN